METIKNYFANNRKRYQEKPKKLKGYEFISVIAVCVLYCIIINAIRGFSWPFWNSPSNQLKLVIGTIILAIVIFYSYKVTDYFYYKYNK